MQRHPYEIRTQGNVKVGEVGVCNGGLVIYVKHGRNTDSLTLEELLGQVLGDYVDYRLIVSDDEYKDRLTDVWEQERYKIGRIDSIE